MDCQETRAASPLKSDAVFSSVVPQTPTSRRPDLFAITFECKHSPVIRRTPQSKSTAFLPNSGNKLPIKHPHEQILFDVRNMFVLTPKQMMYVKTLPKDKVLELIEIYNQIMENVNMVFS